MEGKKERWDPAGFPVDTVRNTNLLTYLF